MMSHQQGKIVEAVMVMISLNVTNVDWYTNQRNALLLESDVTGMVKTIIMPDSVIKLPRRSIKLSTKVTMICSV